jgi:hypothetical protein
VPGQHNSLTHPLVPQPQHRRAVPFATVTEMHSRQSWLLRLMHITVRQPMLPSQHCHTLPGHICECTHLMAVFFARMVIPRSRSSALLSITRTAMSCTHKQHTQQTQ